MDGINGSTLLLEIFSELEEGIDELDIADDELEELDNSVTLELDECVSLELDKSVTLELDETASLELDGISFELEEVLSLKLDSDELDSTTSLELETSFLLLELDRDELDSIVSLELKTRVSLLELDSSRGSSPFIGLDEFDPSSEQPPMQISKAAVAINEQNNFFIFNLPLAY